MLCGRGLSVRQTADPPNIQPLQHAPAVGPTRLRRPHNCVVEPPRVGIPGRFTFHARRAAPPAASRRPTGVAADLHPGRHATTSGFPLAADPSQSLLTYTAEPESPSLDALRLLASCAATTDDIDDVVDNLPDPAKGGDKQISLAPAPPSGRDVRAPS
jgi:hypothetical protein